MLKKIQLKLKLIDESKLPKDSKINSKCHKKNSQIHLDFFAWFLSFIKNHVARGLIDFSFQHKFRHCWIFGFEWGFLWEIHKFWLTREFLVQDGSFVALRKRKRILGNFQQGRGHIFSRHFTVNGNPSLRKVKNHLEFYHTWSPKKKLNYS